MDESVPIEHRGMSVICVTCQNTHKVAAAWFWNGLSQGYGPFNYICCKCGKIIHEGKNDDEDYEEEIEGSD